MTEAAPETPPAENTEAAPPEGQEPKTFDAEYVEKLRKENAKHRTDAKNLAAELEKVRQSAMTDAEKAVAEAEARGKAAATADYGKRLATARFEALASRRNPTVAVADVLEFVDMGRFLGDDGELDEKAIAAAVEKLVPAPENGVPNFDGGTRTTPPAPTSMTGLIRKATGRA